MSEPLSVSRPAAGPHATAVAVQPAELLPLQPRGTRPRPNDRSADRRITVVGLAIAAGFLALAGASALVPNVRGQWLPLHLVLAGAATVAIGSVMPFFAAALVNGPPAPAAARVAVVALLTVGALSVTAGFRASTPHAAA